MFEPVIISTFLYNDAFLRYNGEHDHSIAMLTFNDT